MTSHQLSLHNKTSYKMAISAVKRRRPRAVQQQSLAVHSTFRLLVTGTAVLLLGFFPQLNHRMMVSGEDSLETLDHVICLRSNGFFPHDMRCDHFYECRNATIINEGICKAGLRFDYRYRKKPRCIAADLIDCRITQLPESSGNIPPTTMLFELSTTDRTTPPPTTTERFTFPPFITTTATTTTTTTPAPRIFTTTTTPSPTTNNRFGFDASPPTPTVWPVHMSTRSRSRNSKPKSLQKLVEEEVLITPAPEEDEDEDRRRHHNHNNNHHHLDDNTLTKKRKLLRKPLKLRRGHLQSAEPSSFIGHTSSGGSTSGHNGHLTAASGGGSGNSIVADDDPHSSHNSLLSRSISSDFSSAPKPSQHQSTSSTSLATSSSNACPHLHGYYADRDDCRKFYACDDGRAFPMSCPLGLAYDELTGTCNWPDMVEGCRSEEMLRFTCPDPYENDILDYGDPRYPTSDCRKFVVCVLTDLYGSRTPRLLGCEEGLVFNPVTKACDYPENVPSCANYYDSNPAALASNRYRRAQVSLPKKRRSRH